MVPSKSLFFSFASTIGMEWLKKKAAVDLILPYQHLVSDEPVPYIESLYAFKNTRQFEADLDYLLRHFRAVSLTDTIEQVKKNMPFREKSFLLSFDDGLRQVYEVAAPILLRKGIPAALFINPAFVDNQELFYDLKKGAILRKLESASGDKKWLMTAGECLGQRSNSLRQLRAAVRSIHYPDRHLTDRLGLLLGLDFEALRKKQRPFMTTGEIKDLIAKGFAVGSHSIDHPLYSLIPPEEQLRQTRESTNWVTTTFGLPYKAFAFPHVDTGVGPAFFRELFDPALTEGIDPPHPPMDLVFGNRTGMLEKNPFVLHRFIGENPAIPMEKMVPAVLAYGIARKSMGRSFVKAR